MQSCESTSKIPNTNYPYLASVCKVLFGCPLYSFTKTRMYGPLRGPTSSSRGELWLRHFVALRAKKAFFFFSFVNI